MVTKFLRIAVSLIAVLVWRHSLADEAPTDFWQGFRLGGYSSVDLRIPRTETTQLRLNEISMILTWDQNTRFKFFGELELEDPIRYQRRPGWTDQGSYLDLERLYLDYNINEQSNLRSGRFLTPIGRWNQLHAAPLVWTASRPLVTKTLFPYATNGAMLFGTVGFNERSLEYQVYAEALKDQHKDNDETIYREMRGARITLNNLLHFSGENAGLNAIGLNIASYQEDRPNAPQFRLYGLDFLLAFDRWELLGEAYTRQTPQGKDAGHGAYLQSAYMMADDWYWITRLETLNVPNNADADRWVLGVTKRVKPNQLLKLEFIGGSDAYEEVPRGFTASFAVMF